jgi:hypothetical protein
LPCRRCRHFCCPPYWLAADTLIPRFSSACPTTKSPHSCADFLLSCLPSTRVHGLPGLYRLPANKNGSCPTRGTRQYGGNFYYLGEINPYCIREDKEFTMGHLIPSLGDNAGDKAAECCCTQRFIAMAVRKTSAILRYLCSSFLSLGGRYTCSTTLPSAFVMSHRDSWSSSIGMA